MFTIYIVTNHEEQWEKFCHAISNKVTFQFFSSCTSCKEKIKLTPSTAIIIDIPCTAAQLRQNVIAFLQINAFIHVTGTTDMSEEDWHDKMEGLGMLKPISFEKTGKEAFSLLSQIELLSL